MKKAKLDINNKLFYTLYEAVLNNDIKTVKKCINLNAHYEHEDNETPLHCAAKWTLMPYYYTCCVNIRITYGLFLRSSY